MASRRLDVGYHVIESRKPLPLEALLFPQLGRILKRAIKTSSESGPLKAAHLSRHKWP